MCLTLNPYSHALSALQADVAEKVDAVLSGSVSARPAAVEQSRFIEEK